MMNGTGPVLRPGLTCQTCVSSRPTEPLLGLCSANGGEQIPEDHIEHKPPASSVPERWISWRNPVGETTTGQGDVRQARLALTSDGRSFASAARTSNEGEGVVDKTRSKRETTGPGRRIFERHRLQSRRA